MHSFWRVQFRIFLIVPYSRADVSGVNGPGLATCGNLGGSIRNPYELLEGISTPVSNDNNYFFRVLFSCLRLKVLQSCDQGTELYSPLREYMKNNTSVL